MEEEMKQLLLQEYHQDRWMLENDDKFTLCTDALNAIFMETSATEFVVDAKDESLY